MTRADAKRAFFGALEVLAGEGQVLYVGPFVVVGDRRGGYLGNLELSIGPRPSDGALSVHVAFVGVPRESRREGRGRALMSLVTDAADIVGLPVDLTVAPRPMADDKKAPVSKLKLREFYADFGFKKIRGMGADYMERQLR